MKQKDYPKLDRYLNRNRVQRIPPPLTVEYSSLPPPRRAFWRVTLDVAFGAGVRLGIALGCLGAAIAIGLWQEPAALAGILLVVFSILSFMVLVAMIRR